MGTIRREFGAALASMLVLAAAASGQQGVPAVAGAEVEPRAFFDALVERYRHLEVYEDVADVVEVVTRDGRPPQRVETRIACRLEGDALRIVTPGAQVRSGVGLPLEPSPAMEALVLRYNLWLAPHMALHFAEDPLRDLRPGVPGGFVPFRAEVVADDEKVLVHLALRGVTSPSARPKHDTAELDFWVNPESMLVERITGRQRLPDGAAYEVTLDIEPRMGSERE